MTFPGRTFFGIAGASLATVGLVAFGLGAGGSGPPAPPIGEHVTVRHAHGGDRGASVRRDRGKLVGLDREWVVIESSKPGSVTETLWISRDKVQFLSHQSAPRLQYRDAPPPVEPAPPPVEPVEDKAADHSHEH
jgi:hypothetical protein